MTTATATLSCAGCSDPIEEYADEDSLLGRCCANLPAPWHMGRDGYYTETTPRGEEPEDHDSTEPECASCGSTSFECVERLRSWRYVNADDDGVLYIGDSYDTDVTESSIECAHCSTQYHGRWEYE